MAYRFVEHVGEVEIELTSDTQAGVFESALSALAELVGTPEPGEPATRRIELEDDDPALLLVDWLGELVFLAEVETFVPERIDAFALDEGRLQAVVEGKTALARHLVKAVTLNNLRLEQEGGRWHGRVVLDV